MKIKLGTIFNLGVKNSGLYSDIFYKYQNSQEEKIAIYSSQKNILGYLPKSILKPNSIYSTKYALIMYRQGNAGTLFIPHHRSWACSENAIPLLLKKEYKNKIDLEDLIIKIQNLVYERTTGRADNANANWDMIKNIEIEYRDNNTKKEYDKLKNVLLVCRRLKSIVHKQINKSVILKGDKVKIKKIFYVTSGVRITQKQVYAHKGDLPCVTSQITNQGITWRADENWLSKFRKNNRGVIIDKPCVTWSKDGNAGKLFYRDYRFYPNDHCGVLLPKKRGINLKWFMYAYQQSTYPYVTAKKSQGMLYEEQMENIDIILPDDETIQKQVVDEYERLINIRDMLNIIESRSNHQLQKIAI